MGLSPLIDTSTLASRIGEVTVLDVRYRMDGPSGPDEYAAGHVPGAVYVDLDAALAGPPGPRGRHPLPEPAQFLAAMRAAGVDGDRPVVVYDDWSGHAAARCWWLLRYYGHRRVQVLDGGWTAWRDAGGAVETGPADGGARHPGSFDGRPGQLPVLEVGEVLGFAELNLLLDARAPERYRGEVEPIDPVAGHIPGASNAPTSANLTADGRFRDADELREHYRRLGADHAAEVGVYCGSGVTAAHDVLALEVAGYHAVLYPGSWSEWVADPNRPVARG